MPVHPGPTSVYIPSLGDQQAASEVLLNEFSRNPSSFSINQYVQIRPVQAVSGFFARINTEDAVRVPQIQEFVWPENSDRPSGTSRRHEFVPYECERFAHNFTVGSLTASQAPWDIIASHARGDATQFMTRRTMQVYDLLGTAGNWDGNTGTTATLDTGDWTGSSASDGFIQKTVQSVTRSIHQQTGGVIKPRNVTMILSPELANAISETPEVLSYIKNYDAALRLLTGAGAEFFEQWSLPPRLFGVNVLVEDAVVERAREGETSNLGYVMGDEEVFFVSREGDLEGTENAPQAPTYSTVSMFAQEDMTVEMNTSLEEAQWNRRLRGSIVDNIDFKLTSPASGFYISDVTASP